MVSQDINTLTSLFPWQVKNRDGAGLWVGHVSPCLRLLFLCWPDRISSLIDPKGMSHWWKCFAYPCAIAQRLQDRWKQDLRRGRGSSVVFDEGDGCQLFAELLQHDHPLQKRHVVDAMATNMAVRSIVKTAAQKTLENTGRTYVMPSGSKPKSLFLTSSSLGVKSGIR